MHLIQTFATEDMNGELVPILAAVFDPTFRVEDCTIPDEVADKPNVPPTGLFIRCVFTPEGEIAPTVEAKERTVMYSLFGFQPIYDGWYVFTLVLTTNPIQAMSAEIVRREGKLVLNEFTSELVSWKGILVARTETPPLSVMENWTIYEESEYFMVQKIVNRVERGIIGA